MKDTTKFQEGQELDELKEISEMRRKKFWLMGLMGLFDNSAISTFFAVCFCSEKVILI